MNTSAPIGRHSYNPECGCNQCEPEIVSTIHDSFDISILGGRIAIETEYDEEDSSSIEITFAGFWPDDGGLLELTLSDEEKQAMITIQKLGMRIRGIL